MNKKGAESKVKFLEPGESSRTVNPDFPTTAVEIKAESKTLDSFHKGSETVLLVDDEEMVVNVSRELLRQMGYEVFVATNGPEALETYEKNMSEIDMVLLDMVMPNMGGGEIYDRMKAINPDIKVLLSSGCNIEGEAEKILQRGCDGFIQKPFSINEVSQKLREILQDN